MPSRMSCARIQVVVVPKVVTGLDGHHHAEVRPREVLLSVVV